MAAWFGLVDLVQFGPVDATKSTRSVTPMRVRRFKDEQFTYAFIYGAWGDDLIFPEPMVTHEWHRGLVDGTRDDDYFPLKLPRAWEGSGWYRTECYLH